MAVKNGFMGEAELAVVRAWLAARRDGDYDAAVAMMSDDVVWESPVAGAQHGRAAVREMLAAADEETRSFDSTPIAVRSRGTEVGTVVRNRGRRGEDTLDSTQLLLFAVGGGLIRSVRILVDDPAAVREFWEGE
jgi:ketosteroid isomerase-like protein